ncbi:unnamed protein product [Rhizophagus irregularis]|nr:unnamed protein product [Rhizophagus irregularis]
MLSEKNPIHPPESVAPATKREYLTPESSFEYCVDVLQRRHVTTQDIPNPNTVLIPNFFPQFPFPPTFKSPNC